MHFRYEATTSTEQIWNDTLLFPSVSICNVNIFSNNITTQKYPALAQIYSGTFKQQEHSPYPNANQPNVHTSDTTLEYNETVLNIFRQLLPPINKVFLECSWKNSPFTCTEHIDTITSDNALCYHFPAKNTTLDLYTYQPGSEFGFYAIMDIQQEDYLMTMKMYKYSAGMKISITDHGIIPVTSVSGISIEPGKQYDVGIVRTERYRLSTPYAKSECIDSDQYNYEYCLATCQNNIRFDQCNCTMLSDGDDACLISIIPTCSDFKNNDYYTGKCDCKPSCEEITYTASLSSLRYPSDVGYNHMENVENRTKEYMEKNYIWLDVFYKNMEFITIIQNPAMTLTQVIGDIGGQLGLCLGASLVTIAELLDLFIKCMVKLACREPTSKKNQVSVINRKF